MGPFPLPFRERENSDGSYVTHLSRLTLTAFRNYGFLRLETGPGAIVLTGPNGAGKTNLLEAISLLAPGRGLRNAKLSELTQAGQQTPWAVAGQIAGTQGLSDVGTGQEDSPDRRVVRIEGANRAQGALAELSAILWLTPAMDRLFAEPSSARRKFLDRIIYGYDPAHATRVNRYDQALRERQKLLEENRHPAWLDGIETILAETGVAIAASRLSITARLNQACQAARDSPFPIPSIDVGGEVESFLSRHGSALNTEDWFKESLLANRRPDAASGRSALGVHRSDLLVRYTAKDMPASLCSTGEQKALLITLVLANAELMIGINGNRPILLLDEITAHLDAGRREALFERIAGLQLQAWMSGTEASAFDSLRESATFLHIEHGSVSALAPA